MAHTEYTVLDCLENKGDSIECTFMGFDETHFSENVNKVVFKIKTDKIYYIPNYPNLAILLKEVPVNKVINIECTDKKNVGVVPDVRFFKITT